MPADKASVPAQRRVTNELPAAGERRNDLERRGRRSHDVPMPIAVAAVLDAPLITAAGGATTLRAHLGQKTTVVVFLRHFG